MKGLSSITTKYILLGLFVIGVMVSVMFLPFWFASHIKNDATRINHAGRQRMRSVVMAWLLNKAASETGEKRAETLNSLKGEVVVFEEILYALRDGSNKYQLTPLDQGPYALSQMNNLIEQWHSRVQPTLTEAVEGSVEAFGKYNVFIRSYYVREIDIFVDHLEGEYNKWYMFYRRLRLSVMVVYGLVFVAVAFFVKRGLVAPVLRLRDAVREIEKGNLDVKVEATGRDEIGELSNAFNRMAQARKSVEKSLIENEERLQAVVQTAADAIVSADSSGTIIFWNRCARDSFDYTEEEVVGRPATILMPERYRRPHQEGVERFGSTGVPRIIGKTVQVHGLRKDGSEFPLDLSLATWKTGGDVFYTAIIRDATERKKMEQELEKLAITDSLTGAYNRVRFREIFEREIEGAKRYSQPLSLVLFDIDDFKNINDTYGHVEGDHVLKTIAEIAQENIRKADYLIRWGGEEFIICAPRTDLARAKVLAERIRRRIESHQFDKGERVTVSLGVTRCRKGDGEDELIERADAALYKAKTHGKNRIEISI